MSSFEIGVVKVDGVGYVHISFSRTHFVQFNGYFSM